MQNDDDDPMGRNPDARQADYTNAPSSARLCLAARAADFIEASGQMCRTERPDIWAHRLPQDKVSIISLARRGRSTYGISSHGLLAEHTVEVTHALFPNANLRSANNIFISLNGRVTAFQHAAFPREELEGRHAGVQCHVENAHARLHGFLHQPNLLGHGPAPAALHGGDDFDPSKRLVRALEHSRKHGALPAPDALH